MLGKVLIGLTVVPALVSCGSGAVAPAAPTGVRVISVEAQGSQFAPAAITAGAGETVTVKVENRDGYEHNFSIPELGVDQDIDKGDTRSLTFKATGTVNLQFFCKYHRARGMVGVLNRGGVVTPGSAAPTPLPGDSGAPAYGAGY